MVKTTCVVGARPNFIKMAAIIDEIKRRPHFSHRLVHTGQHYSPEMSANFFRDLDLPQPEVNLGVGGGSQTEQTAAIMLSLEKELNANKPDLLLVVGDVNSTVAAALVAAKLAIPIVHVEAGLRSFDRSMPEEINRIITDALADYLFVTERSGITNLVTEGIPRSKIHFVGNVMIDTLLRFRTRAASSDILDRLALKPGKYVVVTLHRPSNVDNPCQLAKVMNILAVLCRHIPIVFPAHPRTRQRLQAVASSQDGLHVCSPLGYLDFIRLMSDAALMLTDSGGIQEETTILGVPCLTLRENTERPVTIEQGTNRLVGVHLESVLSIALAKLEKRDLEFRKPELWDGKASSRIFDVLERKL